MDCSSKLIETLHLPHRPIKVGRIRYINAAPVYFGLDNGLRPPWLELVNNSPTILNRMLATADLDISPVSTAAYALNHNDWQIIPNNSISCFGNVVSVILVSRYPLDRLEQKTILLTDESASAAALSRLIFAMKGICPNFQQAALDNPQNVGKLADAALVIGNAALTHPWHDTFDFVWDLGAVWKNLTGLPFVFAILAVRKNFAQKYPTAVGAVANLFEISKNNGLKNLKTIIQSSAYALNLSPEFCKSYYHQLNYDFSDKHILGLKTFFQYLYQYNLIDHNPEMSFFNSDIFHGWEKSPDI